MGNINKCLVKLRIVKREPKEQQRIWHNRASSFNIPIKKWTRTSFQITGRAWTALQVVFFLCNYTRDTTFFRPISILDLCSIFSLLSGRVQWPTFHRVNLHSKRRFISAPQRLTYCLRTIQHSYHSKTRQYVNLETKFAIQNSTKKLSFTSSPKSGSNYAIITFCSTTRRSTTIVCFELNVFNLSNTF